MRFLSMLLNSISKPFDPTQPNGTVVIFVLYALTLLCQLLLENLRPVVLLEEHIAILLTPIY